MKTLNRHEMRVILRYLDNAMKSVDADSNASWNIQKARDWLLEACIADIEVEPIPGAGVAVPSDRASQESPAVPASGPGHMEEAA